MKMVLAALSIIALHIPAFPDPVSAHRFEAGGSLNVATLGKNIAAQTDLGLAVNLFGRLSLGANCNVAYRNYSLATMSFFSLSAGATAGGHQFRIGALAGAQTLWLSQYSAFNPGFGGEGSYAYALRPDLSIQIKERIFMVMEGSRKTTATATLIGLIYAFGRLPGSGLP